MELDYTYFEAEDGFFVGWFDGFPEDVTQGESLEELEEMLGDMYKCLNLAKYRKRKLVLA
jgi:predicted RNase H-like HicB family nuclease